MRDLLNCLNCGAPLKDNICPYCGSTYYDLSSMEIGKSCFIKIKDHNKYIKVKAIPHNLSIQMSNDMIYSYDKDCQGKQMAINSYSCNLNMDFICIPFNDNQNLIEMSVIK